MIYLFGVKLKRNKQVDESRKKSRQAFTLIEMITSMSLIVMITAIFIANYSSNNKRTDLIMTAQSLVADIHAAQNNTLGLVKYGTEVPAGGWGVNFSIDNPRQYIIFADLDRPESNEPGQVWEADPGYMLYDSTVEGDVSKGARIITLPQGIEITSIEVFDALVDADMVNVTFLPPDPKTNIYNGFSKATSVHIILRDLRSGMVKTVRVNFLGLVEVVD